MFAKEKELNKILKNIERVASMLWQRGWSEKNAGNISVKLPDSIPKKIYLNYIENKLEKPLELLKNACFYMTGTGKRMQDIGESALNNGLFIQISNNGSSYYAVKQSSENIEPTSELFSHLGIHNMIAERGSKEIVVMHTHATEIIALTQYSKIKSTADLNKILWGMHPETMIFIPKGVGFVPYALPTTKEIADATINSLQNHNMAVWEKHGIFSIGKDLIETFDSIDIACKSAKIWFQCKSAGFEPEGMTDEQLEKLKGLIPKFNT